LLAKYRAILAAYCNAGPAGLTVRELGLVLGKQHNQVSGRLTELVRPPFLLLRVACDDVGNELRRHGSRVLVLAELEGRHA
jgi:hypothetical protein